MSEAGAATLKTQQEHAKVIANLILGIPKDLREWILEHQGLNPHILDYLSFGVEEGILPQSLARATLAQYIKMLQGMEKHNKLGRR